MSDDLMVPQVPESKPEDPEDVSWALSTAEAMWARGDHSEGIKWVRRAAEAASEAENDTRALELAKAAADLTGMITRQTSRSSIELEEIAPATPPPVPSRSMPPSSKSVAPPKVASGPPAPKPFGKQLTTPSRPPQAAPSSFPARVPPAAKSKPLVAESKPPSNKTATASARPGAAAAQKGSGQSNPPAPAKKSSRKSRENLDAEARQALAIPSSNSTAKLIALDVSPDSTPDLSETAETVAIQVPHRRRSRPELGSNDPTIVGHVNDIVRGAGGTDDLETTTVDRGSDDGERKTSVIPSPAPQNAKPAPNTTQRVKPASAMPKGRNAPAAQHDPGITTTQAVRVVVWRDATGVHVAPAGTVVSAITVDAMLVALEPSADLTAWLSMVEPGQQRR